MDINRYHSSSQSNPLLTKPIHQTNTTEREYIMASTQELARAKRFNKEVIATSGVMEGLRGTLVNAEVEPDGSPNQRKVLVRWSDGVELHYLPRQLDVVEAMVASPIMAPAVVHATAPTVSPSKMSDAQIAEIVAEVKPLPDHPDHPFYDQFRPSDTVLKNYVSRQQMFGSEMTDIEYLMSWWHDRENGHSTPVAFVGDTQSGKTMMVRRLAFAVAETLGLQKPLPLFLLMCSAGVDDRDFYGKVTTDPMTGKPVFIRGQAQLASEAPASIFYVDEPNAVGGNVQSALFPMLDDRKEIINNRMPVATEYGYISAHTPVSKGCWMMSSFNNAYSGMNKVNEAFMARYKTLAWGYDKVLEDSQLQSVGLRALLDAIRNLRDRRIINTPVGMTDMIRMKRELTRFGTSVALASFMGRFISQSEQVAVQSAIQDGSISQMLVLEFK
jgi:hypothetical protein